MSYYGVDSWQNRSRQTSWEHPPSSRSGPRPAQETQYGHSEELDQGLGPYGAGNNSLVTRDDAAASFLSQLEEVDRAVENLARSGKLAAMGPGGNPAFRRDGMTGAHTGPANSAHHGPPSSRHHSVNDFENRQNSHGRGHNHGPSHGPHVQGNVQGFYQNQRYTGGQNGAPAANGGGRKGETDHIQQAQRRMAAQRERELRNYHQEQQYNRGKPERNISPNMSEEERRDLIARQHRALYGEENGPIPFENAAGELLGSGPAQPQSASNHTTPVGGAGPGSGSGLRTTSSSPKDTLPNQGGTSPPRQQHTKTVSVGAGVPVAPIGTRPTAGSMSQNKRPTPPATSPLGIAATDRAPSSASNPSKDNTGNGTPNTWGSSSGVWGKNPLGVQASVWG